MKWYTHNIKCHKCGKKETISSPLRNRDYYKKWRCNECYEKDKVEDLKKQVAKLNARANKL